MAEKKKMSVAEILAAARAEKGSAAPPQAEDTAAREPVGESPAGGESPAPQAEKKPAAAQAAGGGRPSVSQACSRSQAGGSSQV
jgi:hypothetical protein